MADEETRKIQTLPEPPGALPPFWPIERGAQRSGPAARRSGRGFRWSHPPACGGSSPALGAPSPPCAGDLMKVQEEKLKPMYQWKRPATLSHATRLVFYTYPPSLWSWPRVWSSAFGGSWTFPLPQPDWWWTRKFFPPAISSPVFTTSAPRWHFHPILQTAL